MATNGTKARSKVKRAVSKSKKGTLKSGRSGKTVKSRKQAIAIGLSEARKAGAKVPKKSASKKKATRKPAAKGKSAVKGKTAKSRTTKKSTAKSAATKKKSTRKAATSRKKKSST
jgi:hypothetical protein